jgi:hypothetical protein
MLEWTRKGKSGHRLRRRRTDPPPTYLSTQHEHNAWLALPPDMNRLNSHGSVSGCVREREGQSAHKRERTATMMKQMAMGNRGWCPREKGEGRRPELRSPQRMSPVLMFIGCLNQTKLNFEVLFLFCTACRCVWLIECECLCRPGCLQLLTVIVAVLLARQTVKFQVSFVFLRTRKRIQTQTQTRHVCAHTLQHHTR